MEITTNLPSWARGTVSGCFIHPETGVRLGSFNVNNNITYLGADIMARMLGGDTSYIPNRMGFVFGGAAAPAFPALTRTVTWESIASELETIGDSNVTISPFAAAPVYTADGDDFTGNSVTFTAHTGGSILGFDTGGVYGDDLTTSDYVYQGLMLVERDNYGTTERLPFARVSLLDGTYPQKPAGGWELMLSWTISYY